MPAEPWKVSGALRSPNFAHLAKTKPLLAQHGAKAERYVFEDPITALFKLRPFGEVLAQQAAAFAALFVSTEQGQADLLRRLREASQTLRRLRDHGHLDLHAAGSASFYTLRDRTHGADADWGEPDADRGEFGARRGELGSESTRLDAESKGLDAESKGLDAEGKGLDADRGELGADRGELGADRGELGADRGELGRVADRLGPDERALIRALGTRPRTAKLRRTIQAIARSGPWTAAELSRLLRRPNVRNLTERHLKPMVADGQLLRTHPEAPTHPDQAYYAPMEADAPPTPPRDE